MIRQIITYPDKRLWQQSKDVVKFDKNLHELLDDMYETMIAKQGIGLAAIQVAIPLNVLIINLVDEEEEIQKKEDLIEVVNPKIISYDGSTTFKEGCLSVPGFYEEVDRYKVVEVEYQDRFGKKDKLKLDNLLSVAMQHEMEHLAGHLFIEKLSYLKRKKFEKEYKKLQKSR